MMSTLRGAVVTGVVGMASLLAVSSYVVKRRSRRTCCDRCNRSTDYVGVDKDAASSSRSTSSAFYPDEAAVTSVGSASQSPASNSAIFEPWQGRGVIRALGAKAPEESIIDVMADFYERVLRDDDTKDIEIEMSNGSIQAHSVVLCASSEPIKGILRHNAAPKKLAWHDHPVEVGNFLLRLLYTGTVDTGDCMKDSEDSSGAQEDKVPLSVLLGSFEIAMVYLISHLLPTLVQALQHRLAVDTFNTICTAAIKVDAMALRLYCLQYARSNPRQLRYEDLKSGMRVRALRQIDHEHADVPEGTLGTVEWGHGDWLDIHWHCGRPSYTNGLQEVLGSIEIVDHTMPGKTLRQMYDAEEFSPEVMSELTTIWGQARPSMKRRTHRIM
jgi:hypothetical protein